MRFPKEHARYLPPNNDVPDASEPTSLGEAMHQLLTLGVKNETVELFGLEWELQTLQEWEWRLINLRYDQKEIMTKIRAWKIDVLTQAIMSATGKKSREVDDFGTPEGKDILRTHLLLTSPMVIEDLYNVYSCLERDARTEFRHKYKEISERYSEGFFVSSGLPTETGISTT